MLSAILAALSAACASHAQEGGQAGNSTEVADGPCAEQAHDGADYVVCRFQPGADMRLFLNNEAGEPYKHFNWVNEALSGAGERLVFAMNAGMYHEDRSPVGYYRGAGKDVTPINDNNGPGNFHLKPNGIFFILENGFAGVEETSVFLMTKRPPPAYATQSGPMLVIDGSLHPRFLVDSTSKKRRNGVGVTAEGDVIFALADTPVTFHQFGSFFREDLKTQNALYLDGTISRIFAPDLDRNDPGAAMGPIVGVVEKAPANGD